MKVLQQCGESCLRVISAENQDFGLPELLLQQNSGVFCFFFQILLTYFKSVLFFRQIVT